VLYTTGTPGEGARFLKLEFTGDAQLSRLEIGYN